MCLDHRWFEERENRVNEWKTNGLTIEEAEGNLFHFRSSIWPVAIETAEFIFEFWSSDDFSKLNQYSQQTLIEIYNTRLSNKKINITKT